MNKIHDFFTEKIIRVPDEHALYEEQEMSAEQKARLVKFLNDLAKRSNPEVDSQA